MPVTRFARLDRAPPQSQAGDRSQRLVNYGVALSDGRPNGRPHRDGAFPPFDLRFTVAPCRSVPSVVSDPLLVFTGCSFSTLRGPVGSALLSHLLKCRTSGKL